MLQTIGSMYCANHNDEDGTEVRENSLRINDDNLECVIEVLVGKLERY